MAPARIVLGLGNPGRRYEATRHNLGFRVLDVLARRRGVELRRKFLDRTCRRAEFRLGNVDVVLARPETFMNRTGYAAKALRDRFRVEAQDFVVVYDDADLELGRIRIRREGSAGGHNGVRSIVEHLGTEAIPRVKLGVRGTSRRELALADYVLQPFGMDEIETAERLTLLGADAVESILDDGIDRAMTHFNGRSAIPENQTGKQVTPPTGEPGGRGEPNG